MYRRFVYLPLLANQDTCMSSNALGACFHFLFRELLKTRCVQMLGRLRERPEELYPCLTTRTLGHPRFNWVGGSQHFNEVLRG